MLEALQLEFMRNALLAGFLASITCGIIGTLVVVNRIVFLAGGVAHVAYGGIGMAFFFRWPYMAGTFGFSFFSAMIMAAITLNDKKRADTVIGVLWAAGMAIGVIFIDLTPGYNVDLMSYLFGSILTVPNSDLWIMLCICVVIFVIVFLFYNDFLAMSYDPEFARLRGVPVTFFHFLLMGLISLSVVMVIQVVGLILVIAMLTIPPYIAEKFSDSLLKMMVFSSIMSCAFTVTGLWISYTYNLSSGAAIIMVGSIAFFISIIAERFRFGKKNWEAGSAVL